jgi:glucose repression regulatory protein TUP1
MPETWANSSKASLDKQIRIWDAQNGYFISRFEGHEDSVYSVAFGPDGQYLVSGSLDTTLKLWDLAQRGKAPGAEGEQGPCIQTFYGHKVRAFLS